MRYLAKCDGPLTELNQLRAPMASILDFFVQEKKELERYRAMYGPLPSNESAVPEIEDADDRDDKEHDGEIEEIDESHQDDAGSDSSDTEQQ